MIINTNIQAQKAAANLQASQAALGKSLSRLSSGMKIVDPADDAAGLAVASKIEAQLRRIDAAKSNLLNALSFTQTQDGYLTKVAKALDRMSELAMLAMDVTKTDDDRILYQKEFEELVNFIRNTATKDFNGVSLFSSESLFVTIDPDGNKFEMSGIDLGADVYQDALNASINDPVSAKDALDKIKDAINQLAGDRAKIGAIQSRLNATIEQLVITKENLTAASSRIKDVDIAEESTAFAKYSILVQSGTVMLAQANRLPETVLRLLQ